MTAAPFESAPILTTVYCAASCSCSDGAWALARDIGKMAIARTAIPKIDAWNFCGMVKPSGSAFSKTQRSGSASKNERNMQGPCSLIGEGSVVADAPFYLAILTWRSRSDDHALRHRVTPLCILLIA